jgi:hypothetical protein
VLLQSCSGIDLGVLQEPNVKLAEGNMLGTSQSKLFGDWDNSGVLQEPNVKLAEGNMLGGFHDLVGNHKGYKISHQGK